MSTEGRLSRTFDALLAVGGALAGLLLVSTMVLVCGKVFLRYVLNIGVIGVDQISGTLLLYITFLGAGWVLGRNEHVTIDLLTTRLSPESRRKLDAVTSAVAALVCLLIVFYGVHEVVYSLSRGIKIASELEIPRAANLVVIPLGCALLACQFARRSLSLLSARSQA